MIQVIEGAFAREMSIGARQERHGVGGDDRRLGAGGERGVVHHHPRRRSPHADALAGDEEMESNRGPGFREVERGASYSMMLLLMLVLVLARDDVSAREQESANANSAMSTRFLRW